LKSKRKQKPDYALLQRKIYVKIALITVCAIVTVFLFRNLTRGSIADLIIGILQRVFNMDHSSATYYYHLIIRNNLDFIMYAVVAVFFIILSRFLLSQFAKYFNEISTGLDVLVEDKDGDIKLSSEMATMERKLITIKNTLEKREQEARSAEQRKNDVVMYLAHDIKTPLTSVIGYLSLLDEAPDMPMEQKAKYVSITLEKANRLEKLVDEFFEITRYNFQTGTLLKESIDLYYMLAQMTDEFYPLLAAKGKQATLNIPEDITIYGDPNKLARVFNNVLKNAVAYSPEGSIIGITAAISGNGDMASIVFTNDGSIPQDKLASVFDKFYRLDSARSSVTGGAGLGLSIAKEIVVSHGGRIYANSDGKQTSFTVELPAMPKQS
jgi:two-component system sensor histidine kinase VanS